MVDGMEPGEDDADETLVVDRHSRRAAPPRAPADAEDDEDRTVVVDRGGDADDRTVVVDRGGDDEDRTVVVDRPGREVDRTVVVERRGRGPAAPEAPAEDHDDVLRVLPRRRGIRTAPVEQGFGREPVDAVGANVVEAYAPRPIAPVPVPGPAVPRGDAPLRAPSPSMPSVQRRSRTAGAVALLAFGAACVVSVIGIVAIIVWFARG
jgi:hypothetical protein